MRVASQGWRVWRACTLCCRALVCGWCGPCWTSQRLPHPLPHSQHALYVLCVWSDFVPAYTLNPHTACFELAALSCGAMCVAVCVSCGVMCVAVCVSCGVMCVAVCVSCGVMCVAVCVSCGVMCVAVCVSCGVMCVAVCVSCGVMCVAGCPCPVLL